MQGPETVVYSSLMKNGYHSHLLPNGLRMLTIPMPSVKTVTVLIMVGAGSRYEKSHTKGLSHFLEHMAFKGTTTRPSAFHISSEIDGIGGEFNAFTSKDHTGFYVKARSEHLEALIEVLSDMLLNSLFKEEEIEREKGVIIEEINMYEDTPMKKISDVFEELLYGNHPLGWDVAGTKDTVGRVRRKDFIDYVKSVYAPNNTVVAVAGGVSHIKVNQLVANYLGRWKRAKVISFEPLGHDSNSGNKPQVQLTYKDTEQAHLVLGFRAYPLSHPKKYALSLLSAILGGGMSSRLFIEIRERRGLAYYIHTAGEKYRDAGNFVVQAGVDKKRIEEALKVILEQCALIAKTRGEAGGIAPAELARAKEFLKGHLVLELEDSRNVSGAYATQEILEGKITTPAEIIAKLEAVKASDVVAVAREIFKNDKLNLAVIGPFKDAKRFSNLLAL